MNATDLFKVKLEFLGALGLPEKLIELYCPDFERLKCWRNEEEVLSPKKVEQMLSECEDEILTLSSGKISIEDAFDALMGNFYVCPFCYANTKDGDVFSELVCDGCTYGACFGVCGEGEKAAWDVAKAWAEQSDELLEISDEQQKKAIKIIKSVRSVREGLK